MLLNLSNHSRAKWDVKQREAAEREYGGVEDLPFPQLNPGDSLDSIKGVVDEYVRKCVALFDQESSPKKKAVPTGRQAVHLMGEFTFTYQFLKEMERRGIPCVASTTERIVTDNPDGSKTTVFRFVRFRPYF